MSTQTDESPINELATSAEEALEICWERLENRRHDFSDIGLMIAAWRKKQAEWKDKEEKKLND